MICTKSKGFVDLSNRLQADTYLTVQDNDVIFGIINKKPTQLKIDENNQTQIYKVAPLSEKYDCTNSTYYRYITNNQNSPFVITCNQGKKQIVLFWKNIEEEPVNITAKILKARAIKSSDTVLKIKKRRKGELEIYYLRSADKKVGKYTSTSLRYYGYNKD